MYHQPKYLSRVRKQYHNLLHTEPAAYRKELHHVLKERSKRNLSFLEKKLKP